MQTRPFETHFLGWDLFLGRLLRLQAEMDMGKCMQLDVESF
jgi:hypothetical protein